MHRFTQYLAIACETALPDVVTQQHDIGMVGDRFVRHKAAPDDRLDAQQSKEVGTGCHRGDHFCAGRSVDDVYIIRGKCDIGNVRGCLLPLRDLGVGGCESLVAFSGALNDVK